MSLSLLMTSAAAVAAELRATALELVESGAWSGVEAVARAHAPNEKGGATGPRRRRLRREPAFRPAAAFAAGDLQSSPPPDAAPAKNGSVRTRVPVSRA